jgi:hypothetical protein
MERTEQTAPVTPIETSRSGLDANSQRESRLGAIALSAYYRSEARGFAPGGEVGDWLDAEREIAARSGDE